MKWNKAISLFLVLVLCLSFCAFAADDDEAAPADAPAIPFTDVAATDYFYEAVAWCYENKITAGVSETEFDPMGTVTRAQVVSFLWRMAGEKEPKSENPFTDVPKDSYYEKAVQWAVEEGITVGTGENKFSPLMNCTRGQVLCFLHRMLGQPKPDSLGGFTDVPADAYYAAAVNWAAEKGVATEPTIGEAAGKFDPMGDAKRQDMIVFLYEAAKLGAGAEVEPDISVDYEWHLASEFPGVWVEEIAGRGVIEITAVSETDFTIEVSWSDSAFSRAYWTMTGKISDGIIVYEDCHKWVRTYTSEEEYTDVDEYTEGVGRFILIGDKLSWISDEGDVSEDARFVLTEILNP